MAKWNSGSESGILRKRIQKEKHEELLVFGYACKLFRDDVKALYVDQGKHLIPWMGEESLKIDRYDCRGALSELRQYEANYDSKSGMSETERRLEILCDEERYYSLKNNEEELEMYKEEEFKRLHQKGNEIQYNYDVPVKPADCDASESTLEDQVFVPSSELNLPADMELPSTIKTNARIEKTAFFISKQGPQMEILIKTKQADNPQFNFLNKDDRLHKYYQYLLSAIKSGQYKFSSETTDGNEKKLEEACDDEENGDHYLHPSLVTTTLQSAPPPPLPAVPYKPSADCKYSQLVNRIQGAQTESVPSPPQPPDMSYYQQYYYAAQYYEYYKQMTQQFSEVPQDAKDAYAFQSQIYAQYLQQQQNNPYAQIVSNLSQNKEPSPPEPVPPNTVDKPLLSLAQYGSDSENECPSEVESDNVTVPPSEAEQIITKMASYVVKNGRDFENIVKSKGDSRFHFLNENHEYHPYYRLKVKKFLNDSKDSPVKACKEKKVITPVSFSIKKSKEDTQKEIKSALPVEESDDDGNSPAAAVENSEALSLTPPPRVPRTPTPPTTEATAVTETEDLILEMIDLTDDLEDKRESRRAEDRKKDKIASAAREKLALQLERKKKAAAFLKLKSVEPAEKKPQHKVEVLKIDDSESEEGEIKRHKKSSKKKKSHKRKRSKTRHESKGRHKTKEHKRLKKKRKRSHSRSSKSSDSSE